MDGAAQSPAPEPALPFSRRLPRMLVALGVVAALSAAVGAIAASGGLETVAADEPERFGIGETFVSSELSIEVDRIAVVDDLPGTGAFPDEAAGERVLAVLVEVTNLDVEPRNASGTGGLGTARLEGRPDDAPGVSVYGDSDFSPVALQPDLPTHVLLTWVVAADEIGDAEVQLILPEAVKSDSTLFRGESYWSDTSSTVVISGEAEDLGAGRGDGSL